jgi:hypothetical protein
MCATNGFPRVSTASYRYHRKLRPNNEGTQTVFIGDAGGRLRGDTTNPWQNGTDQWEGFGALPRGPAPPPNSEPPLATNPWQNGMDQWEGFGALPRGPAPPPNGEPPLATNPWQNGTDQWEGFGGSVLGASFAV